MEMKTPALSMETFWDAGDDHTEIKKKYACARTPSNIFCFRRLGWHLEFLNFRLLVAGLGKFRQVVWHLEILNTQAISSWVRQAISNWVGLRRG